VGASRHSLGFCSVGLLLFVASLVSGLVVWCCKVALRDGWVREGVWPCEGRLLLTGWTLPGLGMVLCGAIWCRVW
jgi:hypothetical protein